MSLAVVLLCDGTAATAHKKREIQVATTPELYAAVQPANVDTVVNLAAGTYTLDPGTRLVLAPGMDLIGVKRRHGRESKIVVPEPLAGAGAIQIGDHNAVRWITVEAPVFAPARESPLGKPPAVTACIEVSRMPETAGVGMSAEVSDCRLIGATRGIRVYHAGAPATSPAVGRVSEVVLERNETIDQGDGFGFGIQVQNFVNDSVLDVTMTKNRLTGTRYGLFVVAITGPNNAQNLVRSRENVFANNISGAAIFAGRDAVNPPFLDSFRGATNSHAVFTSDRDVFIDNHGDELATLGASGGISAVGGLRTSDHTTPIFGNEVVLTLRKTRFSGNTADGIARDLTVFGGLGTGTAALPFGGNRAEVHLDRVRTDGPDTFFFKDSAPGQPLDEPPNVIVVTSGHHDHGDDGDDGDCGDDD